MYMTKTEFLKATITHFSLTLPPKIKYEEMLCYSKQACEFLDFQEYFAISNHNAAYFFLPAPPQKLILTVCWYTGT